MVGEPAGWTYEDQRGQDVQPKRGHERQHDIPEDAIREEASQADFLRCNNILYTLYRQEERGELFQFTD